MAKFCIPKEIAETLKVAASEGKINIVDMYGMNSQQRNELFQTWVDPKTATSINAEFEKAMSSNQETALKNWAETVFDADAKKGSRFKDVVSKIESLNERGLLTPENSEDFLSDLVASELGATVTSEEASKIVELAEEIKKFSNKFDESGRPVIEFWKAKRKLDDYKDTLTPPSKLKSLTQILRGNMLFRGGSVLVNVISNTAQGGLESVIRRVNSSQLSGANKEYLTDYVKYVNKVYKETGYDPSRMKALDSDRKILGENIYNAQGEGTIRKVNKWYSDNVFGKLQGAPDVLFSSLAFGDRANIESTKLVKAQGLKGDAAKQKALEIFKDATLIEPKTPEGKSIREDSIADAEYSTFTNKRFLSEKAMQLRDVMNVKDLRFGDLQVPFVKTAANAISSSLDFAGITSAKEAIENTLRTVKAVQETKSWTDANAWTEITRENFTGFGENMVRAGIGQLAAFLIAGAVDPEDYMGMYPTSQKERELLKLRNATPNSIRIGDQWISLDYFGPLRAPIVGQLNARKYGTDLKSKLALNAMGSLEASVLDLPGIDTLANTIADVQDRLSVEGATDTEGIKNDIGNYLVSWFGQRAIPGFVSDLGKATDTARRDSFSNRKPFDAIIRQIPGGTAIPETKFTPEIKLGRKTLPTQKSVFGEDLPTEGWKTVLFGSRVKAANTDAVVEELVRLDKTGNLPSISNLFRTSSRAKDFKEQVGEDVFNEAWEVMGDRLHNELELFMENDFYLALPEEEKASLIEKLKNSQFSAILSEYGYVPEEFRNL